MLHHRLEADATKFFTVPYRQYGNGIDVNLKKFEKHVQASLEKEKLWNELGDVTDNGPEKPSSRTTVHSRRADGHGRLPLDCELLTYQSSWA